MFFGKSLRAVAVVLLMTLFFFTEDPAVAQQPSGSSSPDQSAVSAEPSPTTAVPPVPSTPAAQEPSPSSTSLPSGLDTIQVGPLELTPSKANLNLSKDHDSTIIKTTIRFKIRNTSASDVKIILFRESIEATDDLGVSLFRGREIKSGGIVMSERRQGDFNKAFQDEKGSFVTLSPKQVFEVQLMPTGIWGINDKDNEFIKSHRPKTLTFSATLGIISLDNTNDIRAFSFSDLPLQVSAP